MNPVTTRIFAHRYVPARRPGTETKLLVVLHGLGDSWRGYAWMPEALGLDGLAYLLINAPDDYYGGFSWFDFPGEAAEGVVRSRGLISGLLDELAAQGVPSEGTLLFGFSQGCIMALDAGLRTERLLGGVCGVSGRVAFPEQYPAAFSAFARKQKFLVTHGLRDPLLPYAVTQAQIESLQGMGLDLEFRTYDKDHTILQEELDYIKAWLRGKIETSAFRQESM